MLGESQDTQFQLLESMVGGDNACKGKEVEDMVFINQRTVPQTPLIEGMQETMGERARITTVLESSIRTDRTLVIDRESGRLVEEELYEDEPTQHITSHDKSVKAQSPERV